MEAENLADEVLRKPPQLGYLTISNALQWRLQYGRGDRAGRFSRRHLALEMNSKARIEFR